MSFIRIRDRRIEYELIHEDPDAPVIVFLHEGLGSLSMWKDFPAQLAHATGRGTLVYSRYGHGRSDPPAAPRGVDFMHEEALHTLPELLDELNVRRPILFGHSEGASIALIHAGGAGRPVAAVIALAPHVLVEERNLESIREARKNFETTDLREKLARYHADPDATFRGWNDIWLNPAFRAWNIEEYLPRITCPVLALRGVNDDYGTMEQLDRIGVSVPNVRVLQSHCGHSPHRDQPEAVIAIAAGFISSMVTSTR